MSDFQEKLEKLLERAQNITPPSKLHLVSDDMPADK